MGFIQGMQVNSISIKPGGGNSENKQGLQKWFSIRRAINQHPIKRRGKKQHLNMSFNSEKSFDRILDTFMIKALRELGLEGEPPSRDWRHLRKPTAETSSYWCYLKRNRSVLQEDTIILSMFAPSHRVSESIRQRSARRSRWIHSYRWRLEHPTIRLGQSQQAGNHQPTGRGDISVLLLPTAAEHTFFSSSPGTFTMV